MTLEKFNLTYFIFIGRTEKKQQQLKKVSTLLLLRPWFSAYALNIYLVHSSPLNFMKFNFPHKTQMEVPGI